MNNNFSVKIEKDKDGLWLLVTQNGHQWTGIKLENVKQIKCVIAILQEVVNDLRVIP